MLLDRQIKTILYFLSEALTPIFTKAVYAALRFLRSIHVLVFWLEAETPPKDLRGVQPLFFLLVKAPSPTKNKWMHSGFSG